MSAMVQSDRHSRLRQLSSACFQVPLVCGTGYLGRLSSSMQTTHTGGCVVVGPPVVEVGPVVEVPVVVVVPEVVEGTSVVVVVPVVVEVPVVVVVPGVVEVPVVVVVPEVVVGPVVVPGVGVLDQVVVGGVPGVFFGGSVTFGTQHLISGQFLFFQATAGFSIILGCVRVSQTLLGQLHFTTGQPSSSIKSCSICSQHSSQTGASTRTQVKVGNPQLSTFSTTISHFEQSGAFGGVGTRATHSYSHGQQHSSPETILATCLHWHSLHSGSETGVGHFKAWSSLEQA